jgi:hypothetical protein
MSRTPATISLHGRHVPAGDYETLRQLERIAFGLTPSDWPDAMAHNAALDAAVDGLAAMRLSVRRKRLAKGKGK